MENETKNTEQTNEQIGLFDIADKLEFAKLDCENAYILLEETSDDFLKVFCAEVGEQLTANILCRRPVIDSFLRMAMDYVIKLQNTLNETVRDLLALNSEKQTVKGEKKV